MKKDIIFGGLLILLLVVGTSATFETANRINDNSDNFKGMRKSLQALQTQIDVTNDTYKNLWVRQDALRSKIDSVEYETSKDILELLSLIDNLRERIENPPQPVVIPAILPDEVGATGGFGVLTGSQALGQGGEGNLEPLSEPETPSEPTPVIVEQVPCPKPKGNKNFGDYLGNITIRKSVDFSVTFDLDEGDVTNVVFNGTNNSRMKRAVKSYLNDLSFGTVTTTDCTLPFKINI